MNLTLYGDTLSAAEWARETGIPLATITSRKARGWSDERTLTEPPFSNDNKITKNDAEIMLNDLERHQLPEEIRILVDGMKTKKVGQFLRRYFPKDFDRWFNDQYKPRKQNEKQNELGTQKDSNLS
jgi:hypothetical protein